MSHHHHSFILLCILLALTQLSSGAKVRKHKPHIINLTHRRRSHVDEFSFHSDLQKIHNELRELHGGVHNMVGTTQEKLQKILIRNITHEKILKKEPRTSTLSFAAVKMKNNQNTQYVAHVAVGEPPQYIPVILDTGSANLWVASSRCKSKQCTVNGAYNHDNSTTYKATFVKVKVKFGSGRIEGVIVRDTVALGELKIPHQTFGEIMQEHGSVFRNSVFGGLLGLGWPTLSSVKPVFDSVIDRGLLSHPTFSFYFTDYPVQTSVFVLGKPPKSHYKGDLYWLALRGGDLAHDWSVPMQDVEINGVPLDICGKNGCSAILDTGTTLITAPPRATNAILAHIDAGHSGPEMPKTCHELLNIHDNLTTASGGTGLPVITFILGDKKKSRKFRLDPEDYIRQHNNICSPGIVPLDVPKPRGPLFILGDLFMRRYYAVFDKENRRVGLAPRVRTPEEDHDHDYLHSRNRRSAGNGHQSAQHQEI